MMFQNLIKVTIFFTSIGLPAELLNGQAVEEQVWTTSGKLLSTNDNGEAMTNGAVRPLVKEGHLPEGVLTLINSTRLTLANQSREDRASWTVTCRPTRPSIYKFNTNDQGQREILSGYKLLGEVQSTYGSGSDNKPVFGRTFQMEILMAEDGVKTIYDVTLTVQVVQGKALDEFDFFYTISSGDFIVTCIEKEGE